VRSKKTLPTKKITTLRDFYNKRNKVLVRRRTGGLGDILMHRMIFEDFKLICPDIELHFACPKQYLDAVIDHPFLDKVFDSEMLDATPDALSINDYVCAYETTSICGRFETHMAPYSSLHRSDIWANYCGVELTKHEMHIQIQKKVKIDTDKIKVAYCPVSAMVVKNLLPGHNETILKELKKRDCYVYALHNTQLDLDIPVINPNSLQEWLAYIDAADYVISVDTAAYHAAGGLKKPLMGIFTFADGKVYGKYFDSVLVQKHRDNGDWDCGPCYEWPNCPKTKKTPKPCLTEITSKMLLTGIEEMFSKWDANNL